MCAAVINLNEQYEKLANGKNNIVETLLDELKEYIRAYVEDASGEKLYSNSKSIKTLKKIEHSGFSYILVFKNMELGKIRTLGDFAVIGNYRDIISLISMSLYIKHSNGEESMKNVKNMFMANISHEIRTPLNSILGMLLVLESTQLTESQKECVDIMRQSGYGLMALINDILDISKLESGQIRLNLMPTNILETIDSSFSIVSDPSQPQEKHIKFTIQINEAVPSNIIADSQRMKQVLINLISNAYKFTADGEISIKVSNATKKESRKMRAKSLKLANAEMENWISKNAMNISGNLISQGKIGKWSYLKIEVIDTGIGIAQSDRDKLFKTFGQIDSTSTKKHSGTGLGLVISQKICHLMGGEINFESEAGKGSNFYFIIPACEYKEDPKPIDYSSLRGKNVLIVDDKIDEIMKLAGYLDEWGVNYKECESATRASLQYINNGKVKFDLGLIDILMPVMDGYKLAKIINDSAHPFPLIALSSETGKSPVSDLFKETILKPYKKEQLAKTMISVLCNGTKTYSPKIRARPSRGLRSSPKILNSVIPINPSTSASAEVTRPQKIQKNKSSKSDSSSSTDIYNGDSNIKILIVEDNQSNRIVLVGILKAIGFTDIHVAENGLECLELIEKSILEAQHYEIVFMDISMPGMNGIEASLEIHRKYKDATIKKFKPKIVAVTANAMNGDREKFMREGKMDEYISKPIDSKNKILDVMNLLIQKK